jgi:prepilin-type N-terminal cleavage/methylation domain-containing protein
MLRQPRGFTLLEMILALAIGLVLMIGLYNVLHMQFQQAESGRIIQQEATVARSILARITRDILSTMGPVAITPTASSSSGAGGGTGGTSASGASSTTTTDTSTAITFNNGVLGTNNMLVLTVTKVPWEVVNSDPTQQASFADLRRVSYWMGSDGTRSGLAMQVLKQPTSNDLGSIPPDVVPDNIIPEVKDVTFQYFDGVSWQDSWDGTTLGGPTGETPIGPPSAISVTIVLYRKGPNNIDLPDDQLPRYTQWIAIPSGNNFPQTGQ